MIRWRLVFTRATAIVFVVLALQQMAEGQVSHHGVAPRPPSSPYQRRLSPYLDLFRIDNSLLSPYHAFLQPRREVQQTLRQQAMHIDRLEQRTMGLESKYSTEFGTRLPTGRGGTFDNHLHYYHFNKRLQNR